MHFFRYIHHSISISHFSCVIWSMFCKPHPFKTIIKPNCLFIVWAPNLVPRAFPYVLGPDRTHNIGKNPGNEIVRHPAGQVPHSTRSITTYGVGITPSENIENLSTFKNRAWAKFYWFLIKKKSILNIILCGLLVVDNSILSLRQSCSCLSYYFRKIDLVGKNRKID